MNNIYDETNQGHMMNQSDIDYVVKLLKKSIKNEDWELVTEVQEYLIEFQDDPEYDED